MREMGMCLRKKRFRALKHARDAASRWSKSIGVTMRAYRCPYCNGFHVTSKEKQ